MNLVRIKYRMLRYAREHQLIVPKGFHAATPMWGEGARQLAWRVSGDLAKRGKDIKQTQHPEPIRDFFFPSTLQDRIAEEARKAIANKTSQATICQWYGMWAAWCAMTWSYIKHKAGSDSPKMAYVPFILESAAHRKNGLMLVSRPKPGDGVIFDWQFDREADHIETLLSKVGGIITTAAGNSGPPYVVKRIRTTRNVIAYVRVTK